MGDHPARLGPATVTYVDVTVTVARDDDKDSVSIQYPDGRVIKEVKQTLKVDPLTELNIDKLNGWVNFGLKLLHEAASGTKMSLAVTQDDLKVIGLNLYRILFGNTAIRDPFLKVYDQFQKDARHDGTLRLRLRLVFGKEAKSVSRLPWEFLFIPEQHDRDLLRGFFFTGQRKELILTRYVPPPDVVGDDQTDLIPETETLRILIALSTPNDQDTIDTEELQRLLLQIETMPIKPQVDYLRGDSCTSEQFTKSLGVFRPHIVHFIGHGEEGSLAFIKKLDDDDYDERRGGLQTRWVPSDQLTILISNSDWRPRLIFLHACKGAAPTSNEAFNSCARELVYAGVPAVVAMQHSISNKDAALFARTFYEALGRGRDVDDAVKAGRLALGDAHPVWQHPRFATPVVYLQNDRPLVQSVPEEAQPSEGSTSSPPRVGSTATTTKARTAERAAAAPSAGADGDTNPFRA